MSKIDLRIIKKELRTAERERRAQLPVAEKTHSDRRIMGRILTLRQYREAHTLLCFVSMPGEVDTHAIIERALRHGKRVAVPRCVKGTRQMEFYVIKSLKDDLAPGTFGVLEPLPERCELLTDFSGSICIVPALLVDHRGYRIGYGGGYYDRFLAGYRGFSVCGIYSAGVRRHLHNGRYDVPVDLIVTERFVRRVGIRN